MAKQISCGSILKVSPETFFHESALYCIHFPVISLGSSFEFSSSIIALLAFLQNIQVVEKSTVLEMSISPWNETQFQWSKIHTTSYNLSSLPVWQILKMSHILASYIRKPAFNILEHLLDHFVCSICSCVRTVCIEIRKIQ